MNAKHILVITICVVLPNGLYMSKASKSSKEKETFRKFVTDHFKPLRKPYSAIYDDDEGNIFIHVLVKPRSNGTSLFVPKEKLVGVCLPAPQHYGAANAQLIEYIVNILNISERSIVILSGLTNTLKILKIFRGHITLEEVVKNLVDECLKTGNQ